MTTAQDQIKMFYAAGRLAAKESANKYIELRSKTRFNMINNLRREGKLESDWITIEEFDKETDKQLKIFEDHFKGI